jgi:galactose mutarotase-like enzyme
MFRADTTPTGTLELRDDEAKSLVTLVPERGAIVTRFRVGERDLLFLDESTLTDRTKNVRGGIPLLFPSPGRLAGDRFERDGRVGSMKQHGFARDVAWTVGALDTKDAARATLAIEATDDTLRAFPWDFRLAITYSLRGRTLRLDVEATNPGAAPLPFAFGIHPYFLVRDADKARARIATKATLAFDNVTKSEVPFHGFDLTAKEVDLHLIDHGSTASELAWGDGARLAIRGSKELGRWVVWTLAGRDFVCVEPWTAPANALNTGASLIEVAPGARRQLSIELEYLAS